MKARLKMAGCMLVFGSIGLFVREMGLPSGVIALVRGLLGALTLVLAGLIMKKRPDWGAIKKGWLLLALSGAAIGVNWICLFEAYRRTTLAVATLSYYFAPVFVVALSPLILKEKLTATKTVCMLLAVLGMVLVSGVLSGVSASLSGVLFGLAAAALYASVIFMNKYMRMPAFEQTTVQLLAAAVVLLPYCLFAEDVGTLFAAPVRTLILLAIVGLVHTGLAYLTYFSALQELPGQTAALFSYIDPAVSILLSALLLKEHMTLWQALGAVLILGSTLASELIEGMKSKRRAHSIP